MRKESRNDIKVSRLIFVCLAVLCAVLIPAQSAELTLAYVQDQAVGEQVAAGDHGNAWLFHRGGKCYALLPRHILVDASLHRNYHYAALKVARPEGSLPPAHADRCAVFKYMDLALMRVAGIEDLSQCGDLLVGLPSIDAELSREAPITLTVTTSVGQLQSIPMRLRSVGGSGASIFHARAQDPSFELTGGMSGGVLVADDGTLMGMLLTVPVRGVSAARADARVLRFDRIAVALAKYFSDPSLVATVDHPSCDVGPPGQSASVGRGTPASVVGSTPVGTNRASMACGARVVGWSVPSLGPAFRSENLVGRDGAKATWRANADGEATVDMRLCPAPGNTVSQVRIDPGRCKAGDNHGVAVEVLVQEGADSGYSSLGYGALKEPAALTVKSGVPLLGNRLRLRFVTSGTQTVCAGPLEVR